MKSFQILTIQPNLLKFNFTSFFLYITKLFESIMILPQGCHPQSLSSPTLSQVVAPLLVDLVSHPLRTQNLASPTLSQVVALLSVDLVSHLLTLSPASPTLSQVLMYGSTHIPKPQKQQKLKLI